MEENQDFDAVSLKQAVKNLDNYLWNIASNVVCTICHELFCEPVTAPCGHSFCSDCLKRLLCGVGSTQNRCPLCRHPIKRREANKNHVLSKIAKICHGFHSAFEEDVMNLNPDLNDMGRELVSSSRMSEMSSHRFKEKSKRTVKAQTKNESFLKVKETELNGSVSNNPEAGNEVSEELKSVSQMELKSQFYVVESPDVEKKLRKVKRVTSKQKVSDWLQNVNKNLNDRTENSVNALRKDMECVIPESDNKASKPSGTSMVRVDYDKSIVAKSNGFEDTFKTVTYESKVLSEENDPYEFIASQKSGAVKTRRKLAKRRKKKVPEFQSILNFTKESTKKREESADKDDVTKVLNESPVVFDNEGDYLLGQIHKTYSKKQSKVDEIVQGSVERGRHRKIVSDSEESNASAKPLTCNNQALKPSARRRLLTPCPESDSDNSSDLTDPFRVAKRRKLNNVAENVNNSGLNHYRNESDLSVVKNPESKKAKGKLKTVEVPANVSKSPGWSRVSNLKMDFENAEKRNRPCRKTLNISGGDPSSSASKTKSAVELSPEGEAVFAELNDGKTLYIDDLSQCSELVVGFESRGSAEKEENVFKRVVADLERELEYIDKCVVSVSDEKVIVETGLGGAEANADCGRDLKDGDRPKLYIREKEVTSDSLHEMNCKANQGHSAKDVIEKAPKRRTIPFALMGKFKKKKRSTILFLKLGKLSPNLKRSRSPVVKLIFPRSLSRSAKKRETATVGTQTIDSGSVECNTETVQTVSKSVQCETLTPDLVEVEIQTTQSCLHATAKEVQTSQFVEPKQATTQSEVVSTEVTPSLVAERKSVTPQTGVIDSQVIPSQIFEEFNTPHPPSERNDKQPKEEQTQPRVDLDVDFDSDIRCELNITWKTGIETQPPRVEAVREKTPSPHVTSSTQEEVVDLVEIAKNAADALVQRVVDNVNLDLFRARERSHGPSPSKRGDHCEESDSDIFIEQTPPKSVSSICDNGNSSGTRKAPKEDGKNNPIVSKCQNTTPDHPPAESVSARDDSLRNLAFPTKESLAAKDATRKENDENNQNQLNQKTCDGSKKLDEKATVEKMCIVSSGVVNRKNVEKFVKMFNAEYSNNPRKDMTHLVVGMHPNEDDELVPFCTPKLLYAIANKKWVVAEAWIEYCLHSNKLAKEEYFESVDPVGGNGCTLARISKGYLLENCEVYLLGDYDRITKEEFSGLIQDCGGKIVHHPREFSYAPKTIRMILMDGSDSQGDTKIISLAKKYRTLVMSRDVVIVSIQSYKFANFTPFMLHPASLEECLNWGYPYELVKNDGDENEKEESDLDGEG